MFGVDQTSDVPQKRHRSRSEGISLRIGVLSSGVTNVAVVERLSHVEHGSVIATNCTIAKINPQLS